MLRLTAKYRALVADKGFHEILSGSVWALGARLLATMLALLTSMIIARAYGAEALGLVALLESVLTLVTIFALLGTQTSILRLIPEHISRYSINSAFRVYRQVQWLVAGAALATSLLLLLGAEMIAGRIFNKEHLAFYFALAAGFVIFKVLMELNTQAVRGLRLIRVFALLQIMPGLLKLLILIGVTVFFHHPDNPVYALLAGLTGTALVGGWIMNRAFKRRLAAPAAGLPSTPDASPEAAAGRVQKMPAGEILTLSLPMLLTATMTFAIGQTGVLMLGAFRPEAEVGYYAMAVKLATLTSFVLVAINSMAAPKFAELYHSGRLDELFRVARKSTKLIFWTSAPIMAALVLLGGIILSLLFGPEFKAAYGPLVLLVAGQFVHAISGSTAIFMNMTGHQQALFYIKLTAAALNIILNLLLTPTWGLYGAATAAMLSTIGWNAAILAFIKIKYGRTIGYLPFTGIRRSDDGEPAGNG